MSLMCDSPRINPSTTLLLTSYPITRKPALPNSSASGRPTYPRPTTPMHACLFASFASNRSFMLPPPSPSTRSIPLALSVPIKLLHCVHDLVELRISQLGIDRERDHFPGRALALREVTFAITQ